MSETLSTRIATKEIDRILGRVQGQKPGPTVVFISGVHGNELAGVNALLQVLPKIEKDQSALSGTVIGLAGNLSAIEQGVRFGDKDLNRLWDKEYIAALKEGTVELQQEDKELLSLLECLERILETEQPPFYFMDLHTTSGPTAPFLLINDSILNREFVTNYPYPKILGVEEHLESTLLSYINEMGFVSFGFESGQHYDPAAVRNAVSFIELTLAITGSIPRTPYEIKALYTSIKLNCCRLQGFFEIYYLYKIKNGDAFKMLPGFRNFETVPTGTPLARTVEGIIATDKKRLLFMPLYQKKGTSGFYQTYTPFFPGLV